jgi:hypothetical protein
MSDVAPRKFQILNHRKLRVRLDHESESLNALNLTRALATPVDQHALRVVTGNRQKRPS